ncbi:MAG: DUF1828 domain-containing protein [Rhodobacteraceae bacterium]|nr:DUF1828 domain-containing protein [Paracoccaceae bacterium]
MIDAEGLKRDLCQAFCATITVNPVPAGYAVGTPFLDHSGDPIGFYVVKDGDGFRLEDDGEYLAQLEGSGVPIDKGQRAQILQEILVLGGAFRDPDRYEIRSAVFDTDRLGPNMLRILSALIRVRDLEFLTQDTVRSTFRDDAMEVLKQRYGTTADLVENTVIDEQLSDFPADLIIRPKKEATNIGALYFATSNDKLNEALLLQMAAKDQNRTNIRPIALIEEPGMRNLSKTKLQRAQNRSLSILIFRGNEQAAMDSIGRDLNLCDAA